MEDIYIFSYSGATDSLMYSLVCTRPNIAQVVGILRGFMANIGQENWVVVKSVFRYLQGTFKYSIFYHSDVSWDLGVVDIQGYVYFDWTWNVNRRRSMRRYVI
jgi:hypothetical protein